ncbi:MAG: hypothetical protein QG628_598 [Patescibacteria group bacterium]|nr:hypothetical protein [Patescibacteria group bacterium]
MDKIFSISKKALDISIAKTKKVFTRNNRAPIFIITFAFIGVFILLNTIAATPTASIDPENGNSSANCAQPAQDPTASNGSAIKFGCSLSSSGKWRGSALTGGGFVNMVSYSPTDDATKVDSLHVVSVTDVSGIFYSPNGGTTWYPANGAAYSSGGDLRVASIEWHPTTPGLVFALFGDCTPGGIMRSTDYGKTWTRFNGGPYVCGNQAGKFGVSMGGSQPRTVGRLMGIDAANGLIYAGSFDGGVMRASISNLGSWQTIALGKNTQGQGKFYIRGLTIDDKDPTVVYAATHDGTQTDDGDGRIWRIRNANTTPVIEKLSSSPINTEEMLSLDGNLYSVNAATSVQGGVSRLPTARTATTTSNFKAIGGLDQSKSCATLSYPSSCTVWFSIDGYVNAGVTTLWVGASHAGKIGETYRPVWKGVSSSGFGTDDGTWSSFPSTKASIKNDILGPLVEWWRLPNNWATPGLDLSYDFGTIDAGKSDADAKIFSGQTAIWRSTDQGANWYPSLDGFLNLVNREVLVDPNNPKKVYQTNVDYRMFESEDNLVTANTIGKPSGMEQDGWSLALDASTNPSTVYLGLGDRDANILGQIWKRDSAGTWTQIDNNAFGGLRPTSLGVTRDTSNQPVLIAGIQESGLWRKVGDGAWTKLSIAAPVAGENIMMSQGSNRADIRIASDNKTFYLYDRATGVWRGDNYGANWTRIYASPSATNAETVGYLRTHPSDVKILFISDTNGVHRITNANTATQDAAVVTKISGSIANTGAMTLGANNTIFFATKPTSSSRPTVYRGNFSDSQPTWTDIGSDYVKSYAIRVITMAVSPNGTLYLSTNNNSTAVLDGAY